jgi:hypothetical protein
MELMFFVSFGLRHKQSLLQAIDGEELQIGRFRVFLFSWLPAWIVARRSQVQA